MNRLIKRASRGDGFKKSIHRMKKIDLLKDRFKSHITIARIINKSLRTKGR